MKNPLRGLKTGSTESSLTLQQLGLMIAIFGLMAFSLEAAQPAWWASRGAVNSSPKNDSAVVMEGQLKQITVEAVLEMNAKFSGTGGAGTALNNKISSWNSYYASHGNSTNDFQLMRVGQLKYFADLVYRPLITNGYMAAMPNWLHTNAAVDSNLATIGQLKQVFAFEIALPQTPTNLVVSQGPTTAVINWSDPVLSVQTYAIDYSTNGGATWINYGSVAGNLNTATLTSLSPGANYMYRIRANNAAGPSTNSTSDAGPIINLVSPTNIQVP